MAPTIGLLGGGQLGQMLCQAADPMGIKIIILDAPNSPAKRSYAQMQHIDGSFKDPAKVKELARRSDILTVEIEHVDTYVLEEIAEKGVEVVDVQGRKFLKKVQCQPSWKTLRIIQDKYVQKQHLWENGVPTAESRAVEKEALEDVGREFGYPFMLKARKDAYDGRGNCPVRSEKDIPKALEELKGRMLYAEKWCNFKMELAVMIVKTENETGKIESTIAYPAVETVHEDSICKLVYAPARNISEAMQVAAQKMAREAVACLPGKGVFCVEMFVTDSGMLSPLFPCPLYNTLFLMLTLLPPPEKQPLLVNEIAPRPHNSGHYTIEACPTLSQYTAQLKAILGKSLPPSITMAIPSAIMLNILGGATSTSHIPLLQATDSLPSAALHLYGKDSKPARKIGHITYISSSMSSAESAMAPLISIATQMRNDRLSPSSSAPPPQIPTVPDTGKQPLVAVTMGSDSDLPVLKPGLAILRDLGIPFHVTITSAHRTPDLMHEFAASAASAGYKVLIAAAGGAAHLPGMLAAKTPLPVIGVPVKGSVFDGHDSLMSIVQMPRGVPVACVAINNSVNAALLAVRILGAGDEEIRGKMDAYMREMEEGVMGKREVLQEVGWEAYGEK